MRARLGVLLLLVFLAFAVLQATSRDDVAGRVDRLDAVAVQPPDQPGDWPQWRGPLRDGIARESIRPWPADGPVKLWEQPVGEGYSSVAAAGDSVYAFFQSGPNETLAAFDRETGAPRWRFEYPARYENNYGDGPRATPTVDGDRVYIVGGTGLLHAVDRRSGAKIWGRDLLKDFEAPTPKWGISFSPLVDGDRLIVHPGGKLGSVAALDKATGETIWASLTDGGGYSSPIVADLGGESQIVAFTAGGLVGLERDTGKPRWSFPWRTPWDCNIATPVIAGDHVFITSGYDRGCALVRVAPAGEPEKIYENRKLCSHFASCVRFGDVVYGFNESTLVALDLKSGTIHWRQRGFGKGSLLGVGDQLLVLGENGECVLADVSAAGFQEKARFHFSDERCWSVPVVSKGRLYLRDQKTLACYDVK